MDVPLFTLFTNLKKVYFTCANQNLSNRLVASNPFYLKFAIIDHARFSVLSAHKCFTASSSMATNSLF